MNLEHRPDHAVNWPRAAQTSVAILGALTFGAIAYGYGYGVSSGRTESYPQTDLIQQGTQEPQYNAGVDDLIEQMDFDTIDGYQTGTNQLWNRWTGGSQVLGWDGDGGKNNNIRNLDSIMVEAEADSVVNIVSGAECRGGSGNCLRMCYGDGTNTAATGIPADATGCLWQGEIGPADPDTAGHYDGNLPETDGPWDNYVFQTWFKTDTAGVNLAQAAAGTSEGGVKGFMLMFDGGADRIELKPFSSRNQQGGYRFCAGEAFEQDSTWIGFDGMWEANYPNDSVSGVDGPDWHRNISDGGCGAPIDISVINDGNWHRITIQLITTTNFATTQRGARFWIDGTLYFSSMGTAPAIVDVWGKGVGIWSTGSTIGPGATDCGGFICGGTPETYATAIEGVKFLGQFNNETEADDQDANLLYFDDILIWFEKN